MALPEDSYLTANFQIRGLSPPAAQCSALPGCMMQVGRWSCIAPCLHCVQLA